MQENKWSNFRENCYFKQGSGFILKLFKTKKERIDHKCVL